MAGRRFHASALGRTCGGIMVVSVDDARRNGYVWLYSSIGIGDCFGLVRYVHG